MSNRPRPKLGVASPKPYLLRAIYQWAIDHHLTPQVLVDAGVDEVVVPMDSVTDGRIVLTMHPQAVASLDMGNHYVRFSARFGGKPFPVCLPVTAIAAIYCRENGQGLVFELDSAQPQPVPPVAVTNNTKKLANKSTAKKSRKTSSAHLTLVK